MDSFPKRLKYIRTSAKLNRTALAETIGVSPAHISALEKGKGAPSEQLIKSVAARYNYSEEWLRDGKGEMRPSGRSIYVARMYKPDKNELNQPDPDYAPHGGHRPDFEKSMGVERGSDEWEAIGMLYEIVKDGDPAYRRAIMANLVAFRDAIRDRRRRAEMESELSSLKADQARDRAETEKLRQQITELRAIMQASTSAATYTGPDRRDGMDRRKTVGESPDGIEHRSGLDRRAKVIPNGDQP